MTLDVGALSRSVSNVNKEVSGDRKGKDSVTLSSKKLCVEELVLLEDEEPLLKESRRRFVLFPIQYDEIWTFYKNSQASFWIAEEIDLSQDLEDWELTLNHHEKDSITCALVCLAVSFGACGRNLVHKLADEIQVAEARCFYGFQVMMENIHCEAYSRLIDTLIKDKSRRCSLFANIEGRPGVKRKANWTSRWTSEQHSNVTFAERLVACAAIEEIFSVGSLTSVNWMKRRNLMPGFTSFNEHICRDRGRHVGFACLIFSLLHNRPHPETVQKIIKEAVDIEQEFVIDSLPLQSIGITSATMNRHIRFVADCLLLSLGNQKVYNILNPFEDHMADSMEPSIHAMLAPSSFNRRFIPIEQNFTTEEDF